MKILYAILFLSTIFSREYSCLSEFSDESLDRVARPERQKTYLSPDGYFMIHYDTTLCGSCTENYNFSPADKLVVKGKINYDDSANTYRGSAEQNNEASTAQSTKRVSFVYITIPYANDMIVDTEVHTDSSVGAEDSDTQKRINELNYKVLPESNGEFVGIFELPQTLFTSGLYPVTVLYDAPGKTTSLEKTLRIIDTSIPIGAEPELIIMTDKNEYKLGEIVQISGQIQNTYTHDTVTITLTTPDISEYNCLEIECLVDVNETKIIPEPGLTAHTFSWNYQLGPNSASLG